MIYCEFVLQYEQLRDFLVYFFYIFNSYKGEMYRCLGKEKVDRCKYLLRILELDL